MWRGFVAVGLSLALVACGGPSRRVLLLHADRTVMLVMDGVTPPTAEGGSLKANVHYFFSHPRIVGGREVVHESALTEFDCASRSSRVLSAIGYPLEGETVRQVNNDPTWAGVRPNTFGEDAFRGACDPDVARKTATWLSLEALHMRFLREVAKRT